MSPVRTMEHMLRKLLGEMDYVQSQGAGYYTCAPFAKRFNKLLAQGKSLYAESSPLLATFDPVEENDPKDPADKSKKLLEIRIEITQLISLLETIQEDDAA
ncbi:MAG: hypothetical protein RLZZ303_1385 [Candidatus Hydrogenedentota bacterium]|jgi:hypothetical protein